MGFVSGGWLGSIGYRCQDDHFLPLICGPRKLLCESASKSYTYTFDKSGGRERKDDSHSHVWYLLTEKTKKFVFHT